MATVIDFSTGATIRARRPRRRADGDAEMIRLGTAILRCAVEWNGEWPEGLSKAQSKAHWQRFERRFYALRDQFDELNPTTLPGLAMMMRVEFAQFGSRWGADAMLRSDGPTTEELEETSHEQHMAWLFIDHLERIAGIRQPPAAS